MAARLRRHASWWNWRRPLPRRRWQSAERAELRRQLLGRCDPVVEAADPPIPGQERGGWGGQDLERRRGGRLPREVDPQDAKRGAEGRLDRFDRRILRSPADGAARGWKDDERP